MKVFKSKAFLGALCILLAAVIAFAVLPRFYKAQAETTYVVRATQDVPEGTELTKGMLHRLMKQPLQRWQSSEYADNRISLFSAQWGKCAITGRPFQSLEDVHCHHKTTRKMGGDDEHRNLMLVLEPVHRLIHAKDKATINVLLEMLNLSPAELKKVNSLRKQIGLTDV